MTIGGTPVPKRELISLLIRTIDADQIRTLLKIQADTNLQKRLDDFPKGQILEALQTTQEGRDVLEQTKANYPFTSSPTLYLISVSAWPTREILFERTAQLSRHMRGEAIRFGNERSVRSIYIITPARDQQAQELFQEIPLVYEKKVEYIESDPEGEDYGEVKVVYSLEKAIVWYSERFKHALLLCSDFSAVKPILYYGSAVLDIRWQLPFLSEEMMHRLAEGANPRTASFSRLEENPDDVLDVQTLTISDQGLGQKRSYLRLTEDDFRQQTAGFYSSHPDVVLGGLGISRQYGRIWTPSRLRKDSLLALSINLIQKTEQELAREADHDIVGLLNYYRNSEMKLARKKVKPEQRKYLEGLINEIISARRTLNFEAVLNPILISNLVNHCKDLDLVCGLEVHCANCGDYLLRCHECNFPLAPVENSQHLTFHCINHPQILIQDGPFVCECGAELDITPSTDLRIFPGAEHLKTLHDFMSILEGQNFDGSFLIMGNLLRLLPARRVPGNRLSLNNLRAWRVRAHIHQRNLTDRKKAKYTKALNKIKEKCARNGGHPTIEICTECMHEEITVQRILTGREICLPRLFGYAIDENFDGIHHGREIADIRYADIIEENDEQLNLGIHLKSRDTQKQNGLGRSVSAIKGLYTQYCYSAYLSGARDANLNAIGISIPNVIGEDVKENFDFLSTHLGFPLIILDEDDWVKILDIAIEKTQVA
ncbi:hypothetical protein LARV_00992 [Longilinea arvoryzae]|uniref:Restriction endonuclease n=1 Tax=Longilinea arvoryzae TaxID=360412 RepID=A0A0S7BD66_9CHLR|nr:hypothetical protein [Longilinea arvoryzae]GAP13241.1 hypothetical protein LARV_00992 [Longilinea arvoryzae]